MTGTTKDISLIKQVLQLKQAGESNCGVSHKLPIDKETVNGWNINNLLEIDNPELEKMFHAGLPADMYGIMEEFLSLLLRYSELLTDHKFHVNRQILFEEYRTTHLDGLVSHSSIIIRSKISSLEGCYSRTCQTFKPIKNLMLDFASAKLNYMDTETRKFIKVEVFVAYMPYSGYVYDIYTFPEDWEPLLLIRMHLEYRGGVPSILTSYNLKSAGISNDKSTL